MPKKIPPHLPAPVCNIDDHKKWLRLKLILASAAFGLLAGLSGAAIMLGWIWPGYGGGDIWAVSEQNRSYLSTIQLEEKIAGEIKDRIFTIYESASVVGSNSYLKKSDKLGEAIAISSDGWLAMYLPNYTANYKNWRALSGDGSAYSLEKVVFDRYAGVVYLKLTNMTTDGQSNSQFKVVSFSDSVRSFDEIFVYQNDNWYRGLVSYGVYSAGVVHMDTAPVLFYSLNMSADAGSVAINNQGRVVGLINKEGLLLPNVYLTRIMPGILNRQAVAYTSLGVDGWFSKEQPIISKNEKVSGFMVNRVWGKSSPLKKGDIILEVNGKLIEAEDYLWYSNTNEMVKLKVLRGEKTLELESKVTETY